MRDIVLIIHDIRSCHNVGSLLRTAEGFGVRKVYLTGYTPYPSTENDSRLPHIHQKLTAQIHKTALGAEALVSWEHHDDITELFTTLKSNGYTLTALEQNEQSLNLQDFTVPTKVALLLGREVEGVDSELLENVSEILEIPMLGKKESFNVASAAAIALFHLQFS